MPIPHHRNPAVVIAALLASPVAEAHPLAAHVAAWQAFIHPFSGADHVLAMLAVGVWAGLATPRHRLLAPASFLVGLVAGAALGVFGTALPGVESVIALSVLLLGPLAARAAHVPACVCVFACATAGVFHGHAHGAELGGLGAACTAFLLGSLVLHGLGFALARQLGTGSHARTLRAASSASGVFGLALSWMA